MPRPGGDHFPSDVAPARLRHIADNLGDILQQRANVCLIEFEVTEGGTEVGARHQDPDGRAVIASAGSLQLTSEYKAQTPEAEIREERAKKAALIEVLGPEEAAKQEKLIAARAEQRWENFQNEPEHQMHTTFSQFQFTCHLGFLSLFVGMGDPLSSLADAVGAGVLLPAVLPEADDLAVSEEPDVDLDLVSQGCFGGHGARDGGCRR